MEFIKPGVSINFVRYSKPAAVVSTLVVAVSLALIFFLGFNFGIDFAGGVEMRVGFEPGVKIGQIRNSLKEAGLSDVQVISFLMEGQNVFSLKAKGEEAVEQALSGEVRVEESELPDVAQAILTQLKKTFGAEKIQVVSTDLVGPRVGKSLRSKGQWAILYALIGILIYIGFRFNFRYSPGAVVALAHDVFIISGIFCLLGLEMDLTTIAALLTIAGYSVNDTVVIFDRIREGHTIYRGKEIGEIVNRSLNDTLSRTILTSVTTLVVVLSVYFLGSEIIKDFALAMSLGVVVGTYSSIFVAAPIYLFLERLSIKRRRLARRKS